MRSLRLRKVTVPLPYPAKNQEWQANLATPARRMTATLRNEHLQLQQNPNYQRIAGISKANVGAAWGCAGLFRLAAT
jgi:hypothetical protein